jgi:hypothetical protein
MTSVVELLEEFLRRAEALNLPHGTWQPCHPLPLYIRGLLEQAKLPLEKRNHLIVKADWRGLKSHGAQHGIFKGINVSNETREEFRKFISIIEW